MKILNVVNVTFLFPSVLPTKQLLAIIIKVMKLRTDAVRLPCKISKEVMLKKKNKKSGKQFSCRGGRTPIFINTVTR